ncbi:MAG: hypothetical protein ACFCUT_02360 [Kiloniellaceae bacterium]
MDLLVGTGSQEISERTPEDQAEDEGRSWCWSRDHRDVVLHRQPKTAIYVNTHDQLVIRQEPFCDDDDDVIVVIDRANAELFILALQQAAGLD